MRPLPLCRRLEWRSSHANESHPSALCRINNKVCYSSALAQCLVSVDESLWKIAMARLSQRRFAHHSEMRRFCSVTAIDE